METGRRSSGRRSSQMINRYRRAARSVAELGLGQLTPLDVAIPELAQVAHRARDWATATSTDSELVAEVGEIAAVGQDRLELSANGLRVRCSTN